MVCFGRQSDKCYLYNGTSNTWTEGPTMANPRQATGYAQLMPNSYLVSGGFSCSPFDCRLDTSEVITLNANGGLTDSQTDYN